MLILFTAIFMTRRVRRHIAKLGYSKLTHWGQVTHICVSKLVNIGSDNGLSPGRRQGIIWTNAGILLIGPLGTNFSENLIGIQTFSFKKMPLKMSSAKWRPFCLGLNVLIANCLINVGIWYKVQIHAHIIFLLPSILQYKTPNHKT